MSSSSSYSAVPQSYQDKDGNNSKVVTSPQKKEYNERLMFFVYESVKLAFMKKTKENLYHNDLNSTDLLLEAQRKADENLRRSLR
jgi:hypothetical protein